MSDNGLGDDITGVTITLDDAAAAALPDNGNCFGEWNVPADQLCVAGCIPGPGSGAL